jgi:hypothetical protein
MVKKYQNCLRIIPIAILAFGIFLFFNPYILVTDYIVTTMSLAGDPSGNPTILLFKLESKGFLTANFPVNIYAKFFVGSDWESIFKNATTIYILIIDSYSYPINESKDGSIGVGFIKISTITREGTGQIIFPYDGEYSTYWIMIDGNPVYFANYPTKNESTLFKILDYSTRASLENDNKNLGIAISALSLSIIGLSYGSKKESKKQ